MTVCPFSVNKKLGLHLQTRRGFLCSSAAVLSLAGCETTAPVQRFSTMERRYAATVDNGFSVRSTNVEWIKPEFLRTEVDYPTDLNPGTIVIEVDDHFLYSVQSDGRAIRYGVTLGSQANLWRGTGTIERKASWPIWTPTARMLRESPSLTAFRNGMPGGPKNPLGARALYIYKNGRDTLYRIHGSDSTWLLGQNRSSGCIRMINQDVIELAASTPTGAQVIVR